MYAVEITAKAQRFLAKVGLRDRQIILDKINSIRDNPFPFLKRLQGEKLYRLRIMDYRAIVDVIVTGKQIIVLRIGHRKNVYDS